jgi:DNA-directed RNA polymerase specialized sigma24 family protein
MSNQDIGQVMGRTEGAIKSLYHRTLLALRDELDEHHSSSIALRCEEGDGEKG